MLKKVSRIVIETLKLNDLLKTKKTLLVVSKTQWMRELYHMASLQLWTTFPESARSTVSHSTMILPVFRMGEDYFSLANNVM